MTDKKRIDIEEVKNEDLLETQSHQIKWETMFERLFEFKEATGHCLVPNRYKDDHKLGSWVSTQRRQYKAFAAGKANTTTLSMDRIRKLESIGFSWSTDDPRRVDWYVRFKQLCKFEKEWGHTLVPMGYKPNPSLGNWVSVQRQEFKNLQNSKPSKMTTNRAKLLESIGFVWKAPRGARRKSEKSPLLGSVDVFVDWNNTRTASDMKPSPSFSSPSSLQQGIGAGSIENSTLQASAKALDILYNPLGASARLPPALQLAGGATTGNAKETPTRSLLSQHAAIQYKRQLLQLLDPQLSFLHQQDESATAGDSLLPSVVDYNVAANFSATAAAAMQIAAAREVVHGSAGLYALQQSNSSPIGLFNAASNRLLGTATCNKRSAAVSTAVSSALEEYQRLEQRRLLASLRQNGNF
eukprot:CAMPEP_0194135360 /NCGR_PEP_ID=MMETSP0152-20130528/5461_1 /TAXON_ID=1049557 /ORGANISM="Thalassiothrix antarctica, Strain L6-D1" /LENGTH=410 /DNA_ID=CAMNT_0038831575 /DNA_START=34 /DNA_END=1266 /DNA_ORIENTATION=+